MQRTEQPGTPDPQGAKRRTAGTGSVDQLPSGRWRARARDEAGKQFSVGTCATEAEAWTLLDAGLHHIAKVKNREAPGVPVGPLTLRAWGKTWFTAREGDGIRGIVQERSVWERHVLAHPIADLPLREITRRQALAWMDAVRATRAVVPARGGGHRETDRPVSRRVVLHALHLLRGALHAARDAEHIGADPTQGVKPPRDKVRRPQAWTYLTPAEIERVTRASHDSLPEPERTIYGVAIYTGLRQGELWALERGDVGDLDGPGPEITVSRSHDGPPKNGKTRRVPLLPEAIALLKAHLASEHAGKRLVFPGETGGRRGRSDDARWAPQTRKVATPAGPEWQKVCGYRERAGITRRVRFHDLRHTCASHLVMGTWGVTLTLQEVALWLGHGSIAMTERYAHLAPERLSARVADATRQADTQSAPAATAPERLPARDSLAPEFESRVSVETSETACFQARPRGVEPLTLGSEVPSLLASNREVGKRRDSGVTPGALALDVLRAAARGELTREAAGRIARAAILAGVGGADALEVLDGGARWQRAAVELADRVLDAAEVERARGGTG